jgi:hypothetical protein
MVGAGCVTSYCFASTSVVRQKKTRNWNALLTCISGNWLHRFPKQRHSHFARSSVPASQASTVRHTPCAASSDLGASCRRCCKLIAHTASRLLWWHTSWPFGFDSAIVASTNAAIARCISRRPTVSSRHSASFFHPRSENATKNNQRSVTWSDGTPGESRNLTK